MNRYQKTISNKETRLLSALRDCYSAIRTYHGTHGQLIDRLNRRVFGTRDFKSLPQRVQSYILGYDWSMSDELIQSMTYCRVWCDCPMTPREIREHKKDWSMSDWEWLRTLPEGLFWSDTRKAFSKTH